MLRQFLQTFIPLFVTIDAFGLVPIFLAVTANRTQLERRRISFEAVAAATVITLAFMFFGNGLFHFIGITSADFKVAGGIILIILAVIDLLIRGKPAVHEEEMIGIVPLAMPLIAGPATLTTTIVLASRDGYSAVALALSVNFLLLLAVLCLSGRIAKLVGAPTLHAVSKVVMVLLAAVAVHFIQSGIAEMIGGMK